MLKTTTTPNGNLVRETAGGYARLCWKCGGNGIYWKRLPASIYTDASAVAEDCFPCQGTGYKGKMFSSFEEIDKAIAVSERARKRREEKAQAEQAAQWEANREEREAQAEADAKARAEHEAELAKWTTLAGNVGDKVEVTGRVAVAKTVETQFGSSRLIVIETPEYQAVKLFTSAQWSWDVEREQTITVSGTIKSFGEYDDIPQTQLNRPKMI